MHLTTSSVSVPQRERAARQTHDGLDRSLLCVEHLLESTIEFVAIVASSQKWVDEVELTRWLKRAGIGLNHNNPEDRRIDWDEKQKCLQRIRKVFENQEQVPEQ